MAWINMSHTCKKAVHVPGVCRNPERSNPGVQVNDPGKMRNFRRISGMYTNNLVGKCLEKYAMHMQMSWGCAENPWHGLGYPVWVTGKDIGGSGYGSRSPYPSPSKRVQEHNFWTRIEWVIAYFVKVIEIRNISLISGPIGLFLDSFWRVSPWVYR